MGTAHSTVMENFMNQPLEFNEFEIKVIEYLLDGNNTTLTILRKQFKSSFLKSREFTGRGLYINFDLPDNIERVDADKRVSPKFCFGDVGAFLGTQKQKVGFLMWIIDGKLAFLECYSYTDDRWPEEIKEYEIYYFRGKRNLEKLSKEWIIIENQ